MHMSMASVDVLLYIYIIYIYTYKHTRIYMVKTSDVKPSTSQTHDLGTSTRPASDRVRSIAKWAKHIKYLVDWREASLFTFESL